MKAHAAAILLTLSFGACATPTGPVDDMVVTASQSADIAAINALLDKQGNDWNRGDVDGFMEGYWKSPDLRFGSGGNVTRGWEETNARYKTNYDSREKMGVLTFSDQEVILLADDAAVVHGRWALERDGDTPGGLYTLILRKFEDGWKIVSDTTTSAD